jgi:hypothetical protein
MLRLVGTWCILMSPLCKWSWSPFIFRSSCLLLEFPGLMLFVQIITCRDGPRICLTPVLWGSLAFQYPIVSPKLEEQQWTFFCKRSSVLVDFSLSLGHLQNRHHTQHISCSAIQGMPVCCSRSWSGVCPLGIPQLCMPLGQDSLFVVSCIAPVRRCD